MRLRTQGAFVARLPFAGAAADPERLTDEATIEKWFGRSCNDVLGRACTPADQRARACDRFYRGGPDGGGVGLGLARVRRVAELHGGQAHFTAGLDGKGLGVELVVPIEGKPHSERCRSRPKRTGASRVALALLSRRVDAAGAM